MTLNIQSLKSFFILSREERDIYEHEILLVNTKRTIAMCFVGLLITTANILSFSNNIELESGLRLEWRQNVILVHAVVFMISLISLVVLFVQRYFNNHQIKPNKTIVNLIKLTIIFGGILLSIIDQMLDMGIYAFLLVIIALGVVYYLKPLEALFIYFSATFIFYVGVGLETNDFDVLLNARVNGLSFALIGLGLSFIFWRMNLRQIALTHEVKRQNEELLNQHAEKDQLFTIIAHDLKGPIGSFLSLTEVMADESEEHTQEELVVMSKALQRSSKKLFVLLENLLEYARVKLQMVKLNPVSIDLLKMGNECLVQYDDLAKRKNISLHLNFPENLQIITDSFVLQTVFRNLLTNAIKFSNKNGQVEIGFHNSSQEFVCLYVKDSGIGMNEKILAGLFKIGSKSGRVGTSGEASSGLGLLLCKELMQKLGGKIEVKSEQNIGTTFYIYFPKV